MRILVGLALSVLTLTLQAAPQDLIFVFDNSGSMKKADPGFAARDEARKFLGALGSDTRAGVIVFDQAVNLTAPLAPVADGKLGASLDGVDYKGRWTDSPAAVERALYELKTNGRPDARKVVVFMTDGIVDTGNRQQDAERTRWLREDLAAEAVANKIQIYGVAFTDAADLLLIQSLATKTGAEYFRAGKPAELPDALAKVLEALNKTPAAVATPAPVEAPAPAAVVPAAPPPPAIEETPAPPAPAAEATPTPAAEPPAPAAATTPPAAGGPALSDEERASLEQLSKETGIPVEQLIKEMESAEPGEAVVMRPEDQAPAESAPALSMGTVGAIAGAILVVLLGLWLAFRNRGGKSDKAAPTVSAPVAATKAPGKAPIAEAWLVDVNGLASEPPRRLSDKPLMVGRIAGSDPDYLDYYVINKATVGRRHAVIKHKDQAFWIVDQGSVNGTFVNDEKVLGERQLRHGDRIKFHKFEFEFQFPGGHDRTVVGMQADQTIIAAMDSTMTATSASELRGVTSAGAVAAAAAAAAVHDADDMFAGAPAFEEPHTNDVTAEGDLDTLEKDRNAFFNDSGTHTASDAADLKTQLLNSGPAELHEFDEAEESPTLNVIDRLGNTAMRANEAFDAEASAFFEDVTVNPAPDLLRQAVPDPDLDVLDVTVAREPPGASREVRDSEDFASATTIMPSHPSHAEGTNRPISTGTFGKMETVVNDGPLDDGDETLEDFLSTSSFDQTPRPPDSPLPGSGVALDAFVADGADAGRDLTSTGDLDKLATEGPDEIFDVTGEMDVQRNKTMILTASMLEGVPRQDTIVLPRSPFASTPEDGPADPSRRPK